ncbi:MAG: hypothetical protein WBV94_29125 [Blastocatellia bacterium]
MKLWKQRPTNRYATPEPSFTVRHKRPVDFVDERFAPSINRKKPLFAVT